MDLVVDTQSGKVQGKIIHGAAQWLGIPYAEPPTCEQRFQLPQPVKAWEGVRMSTSFSCKCPQLTIPIVPDNGIGHDEDCLTVNVWAPAERNRKLPVMFWIYGGALTSGEGSDAVYDGSAFAKNGEVVVVTFNYRVGILGGFYNLGALETLKDKYIPNVGLHDVLMALKWVHENIHAFGGDPNNLTIMGESAGATIVNWLLSTPMANGFYSKAIMQSAAPIKTIPQTNFDTVERLLASYGLSDQQANELVHKPIEQLMAGYRTFSKSLPFLSEAAIIADDNLIVGTLSEMMTKNKPGVPILIGTNHDEGETFKRLPWNCVPFAVSGDEPEPEEKAKVFTKIFEEIALEIATMNCEHHAKTYIYRFDYAPPAAKAMGGAYHSAEMMYVFSNIQGHPMISGVEQEAEAVSSMMHSSWIKFANTGDPGWSEYKDNQAYYVFSLNSHQSNGYPE